MASDARHVTIRALISRFFITYERCLHKMEVTPYMHLKWFKSDHTSFEKVQN